MGFIVIVVKAAVTSPHCSSLPVDYPRLNNRDRRLRDKGLNSCSVLLYNRGPGSSLAEVVGLL